MGIAKEKAFPRGGFSTPKSQNQQKVEKPKKDRELFGNKSVDIQKKKNKTNKKKKADSEINPLQVKTIEPLTYDKLTEGFQTLARISEIKDLEIKLSLPGRLVAHVPITQISTPYTEALKKVASGSDVESDLKSLDEMFQVGQLVSCAILKIEKADSGDFHKITATLNPMNVNENINKGQLIMAAIKSVEDHGYVMDIGKNHMAAFLPTKKGPKSPPSLGQILPCQITKSGGNAIVLTSKLDQIPSTDCKDLSIHQMYPGLKIKGKVEKTLKTGLQLKFGDDFSGYVNISHVDQNTDVEEIGQDIQATILYILPTINHIYLSCQPDLSWSKPISMPENQNPGELAKNLEIQEVDQRGLVLGLDSSSIAIVPFKHIPNEDQKDLKTKYSSGNKIRLVRLLQYDFFEQVFVASMLKNLLEQNVLKLDNLKPGSIIKDCKIKKFAEKGVVVEVGRHLDGFVPFLHLSDVPLKHPEKKFAMGDKLKCRVLKVDPSKRRLHLTHKKLLVEHDYEIVDDFDSKFIGTITEGVVVQTNNEGVLLQLFGKLSCLIQS